MVTVSLGYHSNIFYSQESNNALLPVADPGIQYLNTQIYPRFQRVFPAEIAHRLFLFRRSEFPLKDHSHRTHAKTNANNDVNVSSIDVKKPLCYSSHYPGYITGKYATY